jgi:ketosteroid isomerase-like protein
MQTHKAITAAFAFLMCLPATCRADNDAVRKQIEAQIARFQAAFRKKDIAAMRNITTPDFTLKSRDGTVSTRREANAALVVEMKSIKSIKSWTIKIEKLTVKGNVATAIVSERMVASVADRYLKERETLNTGRMKETWVKTAAGWSYKRAEQIASSGGPANMSFVPSDQLDTRRPDYIAARKAIEAQYAVYQRAVRNKDMKAAMATMTDDVIMVYPNGRTFDRKEMERSLQGTLNGLRGIKAWTMKVAHLNVEKDTAVATVAERMVTTFVDFGGTSHHQDLLDFYQDTWIRTARGWRLRNTQVLRGEVTVDGKTGDPFR